MTARRRPSTLLAFLWASFLVAPVALLNHAEYHPTGSTPGWHFATFQPGAALYAWTRNRMAGWLLLFVIGTTLLVLGRRRDREDEKLAALGGTVPLLMTAAVVAAALFTLLAIVHPFEAVLAGMALLVGFLGLWIVASSGSALRDWTGRLALGAAVLMVFAYAGEAFMRTPGMVEWTGGSRQTRAALRDRWERTVMTDERNGPPWRSRHVGAPKPPGTQRIVALGDSFSFGDFIDDVDELWPSVLEDELATRGRRVQVVNTAAGGNDTVLEQKVLEAFGWAHAPDLVVLQYTLNDAGPDPSEGALPLVPVLGSSLRVKSSLYHYLEVQFAAVQSAAGADLGWSRSFAADAPGWRRSREAIREIARSAAGRGVPLVILLFPMFDSDLREHRYENLGAHRAIAAVASELGVPLVDVREALARVDPNPRSWWVRPFDAHPSPAAHRVAAEALAAELARLGLPDAEGSSAVAPPEHEVSRRGRGAAARQR